MDEASSSTCGSPVEVSEDEGWETEDEELQTCEDAETSSRRCLRNQEERFRAILKKTKQVDQHYAAENYRRREIREEQLTEWRIMVEIGGIVLTFLEDEHDQRCQILRFECGFRSYALREFTALAEAMHRERLEVSENQSFAAASSVFKLIELEIENRDHIKLIAELDFKCLCKTSRVILTNAELSQRLGGASTPMSTPRTMELRRPSSAKLNEEAAFRATRDGLFFDAEQERELVLQMESRDRVQLRIFFIAEVNSIVQRQQSLFLLHQLTIEEWNSRSAIEDWWTSWVEQIQKPKSCARTFANPRVRAFPDVSSLIRLTRGANSYGQRAAVTLLKPSGGAPNTRGRPLPPIGGPTSPLCQSLPDREPLRDIVRCVAY